MDRIKALPERTAYTVLLALCNDPSILKRAVEFSELLHPPHESAHYEPAAAQSQRRKRKSPLVYDEGVEAEEEFECARCGVTFCRGQDREGACIYHEGDVEPDYDGFWEDLQDFDEDNDGPIDTDEMRRRYPQGFFWDCCGKKFNDQGSGCRSGFHIIPISSSSIKRSRVLTDDDAPDSPTVSPETQRLYHIRRQQQTPLENEGSLLEDYDDDDVRDLRVQPGGGDGSSAASSGNETVSVMRYIEVNEVVDLDADSDGGPNGHQGDSGREKT